MIGFDTCLVLVYGTLKQGKSMGLEGWDDWNKKLEDVKLKGFDMYTNGSYPMVVHGDGEITAELWRVNPNLMDSLDRYEGYPHLYTREQIPLEDGNKAWMYIYNSELYGKKIESGVF